MGFIPLNLRIRMLLFHTLEFTPYAFKHWCFIPCRYKHWNSHLILLNIGIRILSFQTLEFAPYPFKDWIRTLYLSNIAAGILSL